MQVPFKKFLHGCRLNFSDWPSASGILLDALLPRVFEDCGQRVVRHSVSVSHDRFSYAGNYMGLPSNTALFLSPGNKYLFLFQHHSKLLRLVTTAPVSSLPVSGVLIYTSLHHRLQLLIIGHRYLLMIFDEFHVVQF